MRTPDTQEDVCEIWLNKCPACSCASGAGSCFAGGGVGGEASANGASSAAKVRN